MTGEQKRVIELYLTTDLTYSQIGEIIDGTRGKIAGIVHRHCPPTAAKRGTTNAGLRQPKALTEAEIDAAAQLLASGATLIDAMRELQVGAPRAKRLMAEAYQRQAVDARPQNEAQQPKGCRWIDGDVRGDDWRYCQRAQAVGSSYCGYHHGLCHRGLGDGQEANGVGSFLRRGIATWR